VSALEAKFAIAPAASAPRNMSKASQTLLGTALAQKNITAVTEHLSCDHVLLPAFNWAPHGRALLEKEAAAGSEAGAVQAFPGLLEHFSQHLPAEINCRGSLINAERAPLEYFVAGEVRTGSVQLRGHPDASFAHSAAVKDDAALSLALSCLLIDWKTPTAMKNEAAKVRAQLVFQLLAFYTKFRRAIPIAATDCATSIRVWALQGRRLVEYVSPTGGPLGLSEGMGVVCALLSASIKEAEAYLLTLHSPLELDDDADEGPAGDGSRGGGSAGGGGGGGGGAGSGGGGGGGGVGGGHGQRSSLGCFAGSTYCW
jgi:uncharacterized membrane protein YgcG